MNTRCKCQENLTYRNLPLFIFRLQRPKPEILGSRSQKSHFCSTRCI
nr:MAG TPA: hypothetical protein [Caudoviricetes sp.]